jgi:predicted RNA binding protein YcfA (HicA-like mRNA interferase family)
VKIRDVIKLIEEDGWFLVTTKGSHRQYKHDKKPGRVTIAGHQHFETGGAKEGIVKC